MAEYSQGVFPMLNYENGIAALEWLCKAFGFTEQRDMRFTEPDGRLSHGQLDTGRGIIMLASTPDYEGPKKHRENCERARRWSNIPWIIDGVLVYVDDLDSHYKRARQAGALTSLDVYAGRNK
jgi:uncharacterized glyoxalase superfamily protein PhnB